jgi:uncharacterized protein
MPSFRWRRLDLPGTDRATLTTTDAGYLLLGHAQYQDPAGAVDLHYSVQTSPTWVTERAHLEGAGPLGLFTFDIAVHPGRLWHLNRQPFPEVTGCIDIDLNFTPATNLLPIRRLALTPGSSAEVVAAWFQFPEPRLKPLHQLYRHLGTDRYDYRCPDVPLGCILETNADGFVTSYPPLWVPEVSSQG